MKIDGSIHNLPNELKKLNQWALAGRTKAPCVVSNNKINYTSVTTGLWYSFDEAVKLAEEYNLVIGFILTAKDPYTCIDLDNTNSGLAKLHETISNDFNSYTELSISNKGVHIWIKGKVEKGVKRKGIEIYSEKRFMICTGKSIHKPVNTIQHRQDKLDILLEELKVESKVLNPHTLIETEEKHDDMEIIELATNASNCDKFNALCRGEWKDLGYPSQSEADLALLSILAFYSDSNKQCIRLFRMSVLGKREKSLKNKVYLERTLARVRQHNNVHINLDIKPNIAKNKFEKNEDSTFDWPPGFAGYLCKELYSIAIRPVKEISVITVLGLLAGICGKAYNIYNGGLNLYLILIARSAIGKESMHTGMSVIQKEVAKIEPAITQYINFTDFASGPALIKTCATNNSFVNVAGEWGRKFRRLNNEKMINGPLDQLRTVMIDLYQKSGNVSVVGGINYSNKEQNVASIDGVAYSLIGETTPGIFYESLTDTVMEDGFLSRFTMVEYDGERPPINTNNKDVLTEETTQYIANIVSRSHDLLNRMETQEVTFSAKGIRIFNEFDDLCDKSINNTNNETYRQMWNRAHLKSLRIASLLAIADDYVTPVIQDVHAEWAIKLISKDIAQMTRKIERGDIGSGDTTRERKVLNVLKEYMENEICKSYHVNPKMKNDYVVTKRYLSRRVSNLNCFLIHRNGSNFALNITIASLIENGYLEELHLSQTRELYETKSKCYRIIDY